MRACAKKWATGVSTLEWVLGFTDPDFGADQINIVADNIVADCNASVEALSNLIQKD